MKKYYYSGDYYLMIKEDTSVEGESLFCGFDLVKNKGNKWGFPVEQCGNIKETIEALQRWKDVDKNNEKMLQMESEFINILETYL